MQQPPPPFRRWRVLLLLSPPLLPPPTAVLQPPRTRQRRRRRLCPARQTCRPLRHHTSWPKTRPAQRVVVANRNSRLPLPPLLRLWPQSRLPP
jgi:hypothetical protein